MLTLRLLMEMDSGYTALGMMGITLHHYYPRILVFILHCNDNFKNSNTTVRFTQCMCLRSHHYYCTLSSSAKCSIMWPSLSLNRCIFQLTSAQIAQFMTSSNFVACCVSTGVSTQAPHDWYWTRGEPIYNVMCMVSRHVAVRIWLSHRFGFNVCTHF